MSLAVDGLRYTFKQLARQRITLRVMKLNGRNAMLSFGLYIAFLYFGDHIKQFGYKITVLSF